MSLLKQRWETNEENPFFQILCETMWRRYCDLVIYCFHFIINFSSSVTNQSSLFYNLERCVKGNWLLISLCECLTVWFFTKACLLLIQSLRNRKLEVHLDSKEQRILGQIFVLWFSRITVRTKSIPTQTKVRYKQTEPALAFSLWKLVKEMLCPCNLLVSFV